MSSVAGAAWGEGLILLHLENSADEDLYKPFQSCMSIRVRLPTLHDLKRGWAETMPSLRGDYHAGIFSAYFPLRISIEDTRAHDHWTWIYVGLRGDTLQGYAVAHSADGPYFGLPYLITLVRDRAGSDN